MATIPYFSGTFTTPMSTLTYQFLGATPDYWCHVAPLVEANWTQQQILNFAIPIRNSTGKPEGCLMRDYDYQLAAELGYEESMANTSTFTRNVDTLACPTRDFNLSQVQSSIVTEWDLVCERRALYSTTQAVAQVGTLIGSAVYSHLFDLFGRRRTVLAAVVLTMFCSFSLAASPNVECYIFLRMLFQTVDFGIYMGCIITAMELCSPALRTSVGSLFPLPWALGYMATPIMTYLVRPWRWMQVVLALPVFYNLIYFWLLPESPRWSILNGRYVEALQVLKWAARVNRRTLPPDHHLIAAMENIKLKEIVSQKEPQCADSHSKKQKVEAAFRYFFMVFIATGLKFRILVVSYLWMASSLIYYGVSLNAINLNANIYLYTFLGGLLEIPAYLFLWLTNTTLGRRKTLVLLSLLCGCSISALASILISRVEVASAVKILLSLSGKIAITASFQLVWMYTTELFSTKYRARAVGDSSMFARVGSVAAPYINDILGEAVVWGPSVVFSLAALLTAGFVWFLPETNNIKMPQAEQLDETSAE